MSGLEVLGALASAVQLADTCLTITAFVIDLFTRVDRAPEAIRKRVVEIEQLIEIARLIEHNSTLQTPLMTSVLAACHGDADQLLDILKKIDIQPIAGMATKCWKALVGVTKEKRILAICERLQGKKNSLILCIANVNSDLLHEVDLQLVTVRQGVDDIVKELPAIRDTASKVAAIFDELPDTAAKVSNLHDELPAISDKITAIHDDMPAVANQVTVIHDQLPAIRIALEQLALYQQAHIIKLTSAPKSQSILPFETLGMTNRNDTQADHPNFRLMATVALPPGSWDPYRALDLNPNETVTCIGHARSKRQECRSQVSKNSRDKACQILNQLSTRTQKLDDLGAQLRELAQLLLCEAYHQTQADEIVNRWQCNLTFDLFTPPPSPILGLRTRPRTSATPDPTRRNTVHRMSLISPPPDNEPSAIESGNQRPSRGQRSSEGGADQNVDNPRQSANTTSRLR